MASDAKLGCYSSVSSAPANKRKYLQKYCVNWETIPNFSRRLSKITEGEGYAYCKACICDLAVSAPGKVGIEKHSKGLTPVQEASADCLYGHMTKTLTEADILYKDNMIWFACDSANVMTVTIFTDYLQATETILNMLNDPVQKKLYLSFLEFVLEIFNKLNIQMHSERPQIHLLHTVMSSAVHILLDCFISEHHLNSTAIENVQFRNPKYFLQLENMYLGAKVNALLAKGIDNQIYKRFAFEITVLKELEVLDLKCVLKKKLPSIAYLASKFPAIVTEDRLQSLDMEWPTIRNHKFDLNENVSAEEFRFYVKKLNAGDGSPMFSHLISFAEALLFLPQSSANVERIFQLST
ncbi:hypothetical protein PR048_006039 [Dryococelus australis]|uniref:HAT C-terminal dimerisation domain-containing protein n=1 Tax=Dryococelus australis TaxID=614101 RepID=A0ABQ9I9W7_9NEOP|nr:hypothetical protein PR048_006039 [Dryococelus australis]